MKSVADDLGSDRCRPNSRLRRLALVLAAIAGLASISAAAHEHPPGQAVPQHVLVLHSYHAEYTWTKNVNIGVEKALAATGRPLEVCVEYMDTKRHRYATVASLLEQLYAAKYGGITFNVIIVSDDNALKFVLERRDALFRGAPVVFCGVNDFKDEMLAGHADVTGVVESFDMRGTLDLILRLHPDATHLAAVCDDLSTGRIDHATLLRLMPQYEDRLTLIDLYNPTTSELKQRLATLPPKTIVLYISFFRDRAGIVYTHTDAVRTVTSSSPVPVYSMWTWMLGDGIVGGVLTGGEIHGQYAGEMAARILGGECAGAIPVQHESPNVPMFDARQLIRFGVPESALPPGSIVWYRPTSFYREHRLLVWAVGAVVAVLTLLVAALSANIWRRRRAEREVRQQKDFVNNVLASVPHYVFWKDRHSRYLGCNENFARAVGLKSPDDIVGLTDSDLLFPEQDTAYYVQMDEQVMRNDEPALAIEESVTFTDRRIEALTAKTPLHDADGAVCGVLGMCLDITARKEMERELFQSQKLRAIGQLAGGVAHDFNNLLTAIQGNAELLRLEDTGAGGERVDEILKACERASALTRQLLALARRSPLRVTPVDVHRLLRDAVSLLSRGVDRQIEVKLQLEAPRSVVLGDASQLHSAFLNLGLNARDAMPNGGRLLITTSNVLEAELGDETETAPNCVQITFADTGQGIDDETRRRLFEPFFTTKAPGVNTGLGLASVYGCVRGHHGLIDVESKAGQGAVFTLRFPLAPVGSVEEQREAKPPVRGSGRILLVDDEAMVRRFVAGALEGLGYSTHPCADGVEALEYYARHGDEVDLVVLDLIMPRMGGEEVFRQLLKRNPDVRVLIASGYAQENVVAELTAQGAGFVPKPFRVDELSRKVAEMLAVPSGA